MTFTGTRVYLRLLTPRDATATYASWLNDPEVNAYLETKRATVDTLREYIEKKSAQSDTEFYGIFLREDDRHIGTVKLEPIDKMRGYAQIGILIGDKREWGKGYAAEVMQLLIEYCFGPLGLTEVRLGVLAQNENAIQVYEKLGFREMSRSIGAVAYENGRFDQVEMTLKKHA